MSKNILHRMGDAYNRFKYLIPEILNILFPIGYTILAIFLSGSNSILLTIFETDIKKFFILWCLFCILILLHLLSIYYKCKIAKQLEDKSICIRKLETELTSLRETSYELFVYTLKSLYKRLNFSDKERISLYKVEKNRFSIMGRFSYNPYYKEISRRECPINEGYIGKAYNEGCSYTNSLPRFKESQAYSYYNKIQSECEIETDVLKKIKMKSRSFYCKALMNSEDNRNAIIVFESMSDTKLEVTSIMTLLTDEEEKLAKFVDKIHCELPVSDSESAEKLGF